jgi:hypothetical protein
LLKIADPVFKTTQKASKQASYDFKKLNKKLKERLFIKKEIIT